MKKTKTKTNTNMIHTHKFNKTEDLLKRPLLQLHELTYAQIGAGLSWGQKQMLVSSSARNGIWRFLMYLINFLKSFKLVK